MIKKSFLLKTLLFVVIALPPSWFFPAQYSHWQEVKKEKLAMRQIELRQGKPEYKIASTIIRK